MLPLPRAPAAHLLLILVLLIADKQLMLKFNLDNAIGLFQVPGQNSWTRESSPGPDLRRMASCLTSEQREKRKRGADNDAMDVSFCYVCCNGFL